LAEGADVYREAYAGGEQGYGCFGIDENEVVL
jgi:hypothetical protein